MIIMERLAFTETVKPAAFVCCQKWLRFFYSGENNSCH